jgi:hypothetical protein
MNIAKTWIKNISNLNSVDDIKEHHEEVNKWIQNKYTNLNTLKTHYIALAKFTGLIRYNKLAVKLQKRVQKRMKMSKVEKAKWKPWNEIISIVEKKQQDLNLENKNDNINNLIISLYTLHVPLRLLPWANTIVLQNNSEIDKFEDDGWDMNHVNYIVLQSKKLYINYDKVASSHGSQSFKLSSKLLNVIKESLKLFPRLFLLPHKNDDDMHMNPNSLGRKIGRLFEASVDILRSSYITYRFDNDEMNMYDKEKLMLKMRTSLNNAMLNYKKVKYVPYTERNRDLLNERAKLYYQRNKLKIQRKNYINRLNKDNKMPTDKMNKKHKPIWNDLLQLWE